MDMTSVSVAVQESSQVAEGRRLAQSCAERLGLDDDAVGRVALVATELATNLLKHARGGELIIRPVTDSSSPGDVELLAVDGGPGMADWKACLVDGYTTSSSPGTGLGAVSRASRLFDVFSSPAQGTVALARVGSGVTSIERDSSHLEVGAVCVALHGESACGDAWTFERRNGIMRFLVADGLGHGRDAEAASHAAVDLFDSLGAMRPGEIMQRLHGGLRHTRGAAAAAVELDASQREVRYCGVGNISAVIISTAGRRHLVSHNGTIGHEVRRIQEMTYPWPDDGVLLLHSDGIATHWKLEDYPGLTTRHPSLIAGTLYRDHRRVRDDATVIAVVANGGANANVGRVR
jgi:anti-sigma regulatory factor (Ser/Thr protein kinase)